MNVVSISPSAQNITVTPDQINDSLIISSSNNSSTVNLLIGSNTTNATAINNIQENIVNINDQTSNNVNLTNNIIVVPIPTTLLSIINCGRLSLQSNDPIGSDTNSSSILYFSPYLGNEISLYDILSNKWKIYTFSEASLLLQPMIPSTNYDIFCYHNGNNLVLEKTQWGSNNTRSVSLSYIDGILVRSTDLSKKYLGTIRSINSSSTADNSNYRFVFNYYNRIPKVLSASDNITHTYSSSAIRPYRNISTIGITKVEFVNGIQDSIADIACQSRFVIESNSSFVGVALNSNTTQNTSANNTNIFPFGGPSITLDNLSSDKIKPNLGYNYLQLVQSGSIISTFFRASLKASFLC